MHWRHREGGQKGRLLTALTMAAFLILMMPEGSLVRKIYKQLCPSVAFCMDTLAYGEKKITAQGRIMDMVSHELPLYSYSISYYGDGMMSEYYKEYVEILWKEAQEGTSQDLESREEEGQVAVPEAPEEAADSPPEETEGNTENGEEEGISGNSMIEPDGHQEEEEQLNEEGSHFKITDGSGNSTDREAYKELIHSEKQQNISLEEYQEFEKLINKFYTVDSNTYTTAEELNAAKLSSADMRITKNSGAPQILIYHTHSQEGYADSIPGDASTTVVGVGEQLAEILRNEYGYQVLHHTGTYDVQARDYAYSYALPALEQILSENPSIEVVIDLHRDSVAGDTRLVTETDGIPMARFMFFNGLSRVRELGEITYLPNENLQNNLAFSFQMQKACEEYYPGLTRKIYLKGYRYNMHMKARTLLIELGAQNNTVQEAMNACGPLARVLDMVLSGKA